jgi:hypothetical protein
MMATQEHKVKCLRAYFWAIDRGDKTFDVRRDDRGYQKGDKIIFKLWETPSKAYPQGRFDGNEIERKITYVLTGGQFGIEPGYVVLGLKK